MMKAQILNIIEKVKEDICLYDINEEEVNLIINEAINNKSNKSMKIDTIKGEVRIPFNNRSISTILINNINIEILTDSIIKYINEINILSKHNDIISCSEDNFNELYLIMNQFPDRVTRMHY